MQKRVHIKGYKSLVDVELCLEPLTVLIGANASGKSNFLDALQLLAGLATSRTLKQAFDPPCRGKPLESFNIGSAGIKGLLERDRLTFSIEADLQISDVVVEAVDRQIREMRRRPQDSRSEDTTKRVTGVRERNLRYRIEVEMLPRTGILRVADEYLAALNSHGEPTGRRKPFIERQGDERLHLRHEGQAHPTYYELYLDHTILSQPHYPPPALSTLGRGAIRAGALVVLLLRAARTHASRESGQGRTAHRLDGRGAWRVSQHAQGGRPRAIRDRAEGSTQPAAEHRRDRGRCDRSRRGGIAYRRRRHRDARQRAFGRHPADARTSRAGKRGTARIGWIRRARERRAPTPNRADRRAAPNAAEPGADPVHRHDTLSAATGPAGG